MSEVFNNNINTFPNTQPYLYNATQNNVAIPAQNNVTVPVQNNVTTPLQTPQVNISTPYSSQIYQYPQTSVYEKNDSQNGAQKTASSGVNIYIYNPSGIGGPNATASATYTTPQTQVTPQPQTIASTPITNNEQPIASTPVSTKDETKETKEKEKKNVVKITDDYVKTIESYLRSNDENVRKNGIIDLINRFEEDDSRKKDPALTALLNIALQDPVSSNRMFVLSSIAAEQALGDDKTVELLSALQKSEKLYGREAQLANEALLKTVHETTQIDK